MIQIKNYPNYSIDINGNVFNTKRNKIIKTQTDKDGYNFVQVWKCSKPKKLKIHRLIAEYFIGNPDNKPQVNHINGIKNDNRINNLEWVSASENVRHAFNNGLNKNTERQREVAVLTHGKIVLNTENGIFYNSISDAAKYYGKYAPNTLSQKLKGNKINNTPFILV